MNCRVLIAGGGLQGLSCGASLSKDNEVFIVSNELQIRKSRFFRKVYTGAKSGSDELFNVLAEKHFDVLIPVSDMCVPFISRNKSYIEKNYGTRCAVPDYEKVSIVEDKSRFMQFCSENSVPHPKTCPLSSENVRQCAETIGFPALIKPDRSVGARGITRVDTPEALESAFPMVEQRYGSCTLQELVDNKEYYYNVMIYRNAKGETVGHTIMKIVRMYPISAGSSTCCISVRNDELLEICEDCLEKLGWVGMADFDVLQRLDNGEYKIIEINPRVPASLRAAAVSGVNFPEIIVSDALGLDVPRNEYCPGKTLRYLGTDLMWLLKSSSRFGGNPSWFKFFGRDIYYQDIYGNDPSTWWTWLAEGLGKLGGRNKRLR